MFFKEYNMENHNLNFKQKAKLEFRKLLICFAYLAIFFCSFIFYRNLIVANFTHSYFHYGFGIFEAFIMAKIIMLGQMLHLGEQKFANFPLIVPTFYKACIFSLFVFVFSIIEHYVGGFLHGKDSMEITHELINTNMNEILVRSWIKFIALVPFFAFLEMERIFGEGKIVDLFFKIR
jgi:hypothetical protein